MAIQVRSSDELALMRQAGRIVALVLEAMARHVRPQISTAELDAIALDIIHTHNAQPAFLGYEGFPASICTSINDQVVHGIPGPKVILTAGDIISIDVGASYQGWMADASRTYAVGVISAEAQRLLEVAEAALWAGIEQSRNGNRLGDVSAAVQAHVEAHGMSIVRELTGHGVGPVCTNRRKCSTTASPTLASFCDEGMTFALEPLVSLGSWRSSTAADGWTISTSDGTLSAHFEHTLAISSDAAQILTLL